jgi:predicted component of type VI protein secretion system
MNRLYIEDDAGNVRIIPLDSDAITVGRAADNSVVLPDRNVSRHHARIRVENGRFRVEDAGSRFGLKVNGQRFAEPCELAPGDLLFVGDFKLKVLPRDAAIPEDEFVERPAPPPRPRQAETPSPELTPTGMLDIRDMDRVAEIGWKSDFDLEEEAARKASAGKILLLAVLVVVAAGLGVLYWLLSAEPEPVAPVRRPAPVTEPARAQATAPSPAPVAEPAPAPAPVEPAPAAERPVAVPAPKAKPEPKPEPKAARTEEARKPAETKVAQAERAPAPAPTPAPATKSILAAGGTGDLASRIDTALDIGSLGEAESLLGKCSGGECTSRWKRLASKYQAQGNAVKAIEIFKRLRRLTNDARQREFYEKQINALGGTVD